jgi:hypothetical protein
MFLLEPGRNQNINVNFVTANLMILKLRSNIKRLNKKETMVDNIFILMNKYSCVCFRFILSLKTYPEKKKIVDS